MKSKLHYLGHSETIDNLSKHKESKDAKNGFDKTLQGHHASYKGLMDVERWNMKEEIRLKNSMNRILAAEMIQYNLLKFGGSFNQRKSSIHLK